MTPLSNTMRFVIVPAKVPAPRLVLPVIVGATVNHLMKLNSVTGPALDVTAVASFFGAVVSEQAVMTPEAMMALATRSLRWIMGVAPEWVNQLGWAPSEFATSRYAG